MHNATIKKRTKRRNGKKGQENLDLMGRSGGERGIVLGFETYLGRGLCPPHPTSLRSGRRRRRLIPSGNRVLGVLRWNRRARRNWKAAAFCVVLLPGILDMEALNAFLNGEEPGYAKLQGEHFDYFMQAHSIILGRNSKKENVDLDISVLGGGMEISRRHARIFYDFQLRRFALEVLGRHGCIVQGVLYLPGDGPVKLNSQDLLQIGQTKFYFLLPTRSIEATLVARRTHIPSQPLSSSFMRSTHPHSSDVREHSYGNDYGRDNGDNGIRVGTEAQGKFMKQSKRSGDLDIYSRYPINVEPVGALGERVNKLQIRRAAKNIDNERLLKEEKDFITYVATLVSDNCGPGEWMPVVKLHSELIEHFGKIWPHSKVEKYLTPEDCSSTETKGRPWYNMLELLKKYPEHFVINEISRGKVTSEFVSLVSLLS